MQSSEKEVIAIAKDMGIKEVVTAAQSPWQNPYVERLIVSTASATRDLSYYVWPSAKRGPSRIGANHQRASSRDVNSRSRENPGTGHREARSALFWRSKSVWRISPCPSATRPKRSHESYP